MSVPKSKIGIFSLARAETGAREKLSYVGEARENKARVFIPTFPDFTRKWYTFSLFESYSGMQKLPYSTQHTLQQ